MSGRGAEQALQNVTAPAYWRMLEGLAEQGSVVTPCTRRLLLLTGQSSFVDSRLSPGQQELLRSVAGTQFTPLLAGFPFHRQMLPEGEWREPALAAACWRNGRQFWWAARRAPFGELVARHLQPAFSKTERCLLLMTGSCGLQMLAAAWPYLQRPSGLQVGCIALGPVCVEGVGLPFAYCEIVGTGDWLARLMTWGNPKVGFGDQVVAERQRPGRRRMVPGGHLAYWGSAAVRRAAAEMAAELAAEWEIKLLSNEAVAADGVREGPRLESGRR